MILRGSSISKIDAALSHNNLLDNFCSPNDRKIVQWMEYFTPYFPACTKNNNIFIMTSTCRICICKLKYYWVNCEWIIYFVCQMVNNVSLFTWLYTKPGDAWLECSWWSDYVILLTPRVSQLQQQQQLWILSILTVLMSSSSNCCVDIYLHSTTLHTIFLPKRILNNKRMILQR